MAKNRYYAVKNGHKIGVFDSWSECSKQIHGFSGAVYKGFPTLQEAQDYLDGQEHIMSERYTDEKEVFNNIKNKEMIAYVDGSNRGNGSAFSWGIVLFSNELGKTELNGMNENPKFTPYRNVAGELFASVNAIKFAIANNMNKITIFHDYSGIRHWALGEWKVKNELSKAYQDFYNKASQSIICEFVKVDGHTGDKFNEEADQLAKKALGIK